MLWTYHVNMRLRSRSISRDDIVNSVETYEIVESYPDDKYLPSYLVYGRRGHDVFHFVVAIDVAEDNVRIVTCYRPSNEEWEADMRTRRKNR
jgi:hypothetical protein